MQQAILIFTQRLALHVYTLIQHIPTCPQQTSSSSGGGALPFGVACVLVTQDSNSVYGSAAVEVSLKLLCSGAIVHLVDRGRR